MLIVNADDLGMTPGANRAIFDAYDRGCVTHASIMANCDYFEEAMLEAETRPELGLGMHLNLTYGKALLPNSLYCDEEGCFNLSYLTLLKNKDSRFLTAVEAEWDAQIQRVYERSHARQLLSHIDSHRHIHIIPHLYKIAVKLAEKYRIPRIRLIKENIWHSIGLAKKSNFIVNGGIIKYFLLKFFSIIDEKYCDKYEDIHFYSILYTGVIRSEILEKIKKDNIFYEVMVHPSYPALDSNVVFYDEGEKEYRLSESRQKELEAVLFL